MSAAERVSEARQRRIVTGRVLEVVDHYQFVGWDSQRWMNAVPLSSHSGSGGGGGGGGSGPKTAFKTLVTRLVLSSTE